MASSPLVQATEEAIESLHRAAALWGRVFDAGPMQRNQLGRSGLDCSCFFGVQRRLRRAPSLSHGAGTASLRRRPARAGAFSAGVTCSGTVRRAGGGRQRGVAGRAPGRSRLLRGIGQAFGAKGDQPTGLGCNPQTAQRLWLWIRSPNWGDGRNLFHDTERPRRTFQ